jgi:hypothetical protein
LGSEIQCHGKAGVTIAYLHAAAMKMHDAGDDGQAQPGAAALSVGSGGREEALAQAGQQGLGHARALIADGDAVRASSSSITLFSAEKSRAFCSRLLMARVTRPASQGPLLSTPQAHGHAALLCMALQGGHGLPGTFHQAAAMAGVQLLALLQTAELEQLVDQVLQAQALVHHLSGKHGPVLGRQLFLQQLARAAYGGHRALSSWVRART